MIKGSKDKSSLLRGDLLSSTDWARAPRWDLALCAHRSSVCSRRGAAADSSTDGPQLRGQRVPHPQPAAPGDTRADHMSKEFRGRTDSCPGGWSERPGCPVNVSIPLVCGTGRCKVSLLHCAHLHNEHRGRAGVFGSVFPTRNDVPLQTMPGVSNTSIQKSGLWT